MEPISLIIDALVAGATKAAGDAAPDAYNGLKALIKGKFAGKPTAEMVLKEHETDPETYKKPLEKELAEAGADKDEEIIKAARELLQEVKPEESGAAKFKVEFQAEVKGVQLGDNNQQENTFSSKRLEDLDG